MSLCCALVPRRGREMAAVFLLGAAFAACRAPDASAPRREMARLLAPADLLTNDLDFVVRIDSHRIRNSPVLGDVVRDLAKKNASPMSASVLPALERSRAIFVGGHVTTDGFHGDGIVAIESAPSSDDSVPANVDSAFHRVLSPSPTAQIYERAAAPRDQALLQVVLPGRGLVLATAAEADAVLRVIRGGPDADRLDPPARGFVSFVGRNRAATWAFAPGGGVRLRALGEGLTSYAGSIDAEDGFTVELTLEYASPKEAGRAAEVARVAVDRLRALDPPVGTVADSVKLTESGRSIVVRAAVPFAIAAALH